MPERLTLAPGVEVPAPEDGSVLRYSGEAVQDVLDFFSLLCFAQNEWAGKPFELLPWEEEAVRQFYGIQVQDEDGLWVRYRRYLYDELPKKNGKTELAAGLGLYHLLYDGEERPRVGVFSSDKENASQIYEAAKYMVENTSLGQPEHDPIAWAVDSRKEIHTKYGGVLKVYSADAATKHGYSFSAIIIDELHAQPNRRLWDVLTAGSNAARRQQAVIVLTTAGDDPDRTSIGWEVHEKCRRILAWRRGEPEREGDTDAPEWCPIMYGIGILTGDDPERIAELDIYDEALWYACNPGLGHNLKLRDFRADARAARQSEAAERWFRWLRLNQWISTKSVGWLPLTLYDKSQFNRPEWKALKAPERRQAVRDYLVGLHAAVSAPGGAGYLGCPVLGVAARGGRSGGRAAGPCTLPGLDPSGLFGAVPRRYGGLHDGRGRRGCGGRCVRLGHIGRRPLPVPHADAPADGARRQCGGDPPGHEEPVPGHERGGAADPRPSDAPRAQYGRSLVLRQRPVRGGREREHQAHEEPEHRPYRHHGGLDHRRGGGAASDAGGAGYQRTHTLRGLGDLR